MNKQGLIDIYKETQKLCSEQAIPCAKSQKLKTISLPQNFPIKAGKVSVEPIDTISALIKYPNNTALLNMASAKNKGGGVVRGTTAQEECLFRASNLFTIPDNFYPIEKDEVIYSKDVSFIRDKDHGTIKPVLADVITLPAVNLNHPWPGPIPMDEYKKIMRHKTELMLSSAINGGCDNLILGAWGCGVYKNDPVFVSGLFKEVFEPYYKAFERIVFAIILDADFPWRQKMGATINNFDAFKETFDA